MRDGLLLPGDLSAEEKAAVETVDVTPPQPNRAQRRAMTKAIKKEMARQKMSGHP